MDADTAAQLRRLSRMHTVLSRINRAIVRADNPDGLYREACRVAVESGLFDLAWIGLLDPAKGRLRPMALCGDAAGAKVVDIVCAADDAEASVAWSAQRSGHYAICNDLQAAPSRMAGRDEALAHGLAAVAGFPLFEAGRGIGVFELYAGEAGFFDPAIVNLLAEVAGDISFALEHLLREQQRLAAETKIRYLAYYDPQTGLPSRAMLEQRLRQLAGQSADGLLALLCIKMLRLEQISRVVGYAAMDEMLRTQAQRLESCCTSAGMVAHLAHGEFALAVPGFADRAAIEAFARGVRGLLSNPLFTSVSEVFLRARIGIAVYPLDEPQIHHLLRQARLAAESATRDDEVRFYSPDLDRDAGSRLALEGELHRAIDRGEFVLHYQPQLNLKTGLMVGIEALLRWRHPAKGLIEPARFVALLEECDLAIIVGEWVLREACSQNMAWQNQGLPPLRVAVNLSALQFRQAGLVEIVQSALRDSGLAAQWLELELTESLILENVEEAIRTMDELKKLGVSLSLDDFGTGYSSLNYLHRFPVDRIKLDQSFVRDVATHAVTAALVRTILAMARDLGVTTIAEGVESSGQLGYLRKHSCHEMQGYLFSRPLPPEELAQWLREDRRLPPAGGTSAASSTVLAVDDDPHILAILQLLLRQDGLTVLTAGSAAEGFDILASTEVGVVLSDQLMPEVSGTAFLEQVKGLYPDSIRILLTGYAEVATVIDAVNRGVIYKILTKPWNDKQLRENVSEALHRFETVQENRWMARRLEEFRSKYPDLEGEGFPPET
ncbi:EAL domain-containing protein [Ramlibacter sp. 2FC]|uniref:EAL domain-containing protein n=1 Tax=Ramlibacter sp. 2FC TaxID=2502188 RepID=UPI0014856C68|nr:EAL domain-containing protein [Ramlibacter sp. 2FC]